MAFSLHRFAAVLVKEFIQMRRDRMTFAMMIAIPIVQMMLFGFAINADPKHLPTYVELNDNGPVTRALISAMANSAYFDFRGVLDNAETAEDAFRSGKAQFVVGIPPGFERDLVRGDRPTVLLAADASDPAAAAGPVAALSGILDIVLRDLAIGPLAGLAATLAPFNIAVHRHYNPAGVTSINIVPGFLAIILSMTMVMITAIAIVRELERGTMETLISTPGRPGEVMLGKILPYVLVGYAQAIVFLSLARWVFDVPFIGLPLAFFVGLNLYIIVNLALGFLISTVARSQMQAMQMSFFLILPSILLSGFMFPFAGMPGWAQVLGSIIPATHFMRIVRKVMLKGAGLADIAPDMAALGLTMVVITTLAMARYRQTLD